MWLQENSEYVAHVVFLLDRAGAEHLESQAQIVLTWEEQITLNSLT